MKTTAPLAVSLLLMVISFALPANADCFAPLSVNGTAGQIQFISGEMRFCDGMHWVGTSQGATVNACTTAGTMRYDSGTSNYQYCNANGGVWVNMKGSLLGPAGGAPAGQIVFDHSLNTTKMSDGSNFYNTARQFWRLNPIPDWGGYKEEDYTGTYCITSDTVTMSGITEPIGIRLSGYTSTIDSDYSEGDPNTGELSYILNGGAPVAIAPYDTANSGSGYPEYNYFDELIAVNPNDTLAFKYCAPRRVVFSSYQWDGYAYLEFYNESNFFDYLEYIENYISGSEE